MFNLSRENIKIGAFEQRYFKGVVKTILKKCHGVVGDAQKIIGISDTTYYRFMTDGELTLCTARKIMDAHKLIKNYELSRKPSFHALEQKRWG